MRSWYLFRLFGSLDTTIFANWVRGFCNLRGTDTKVLRPLRAGSFGEKWLIPHYIVTISPLCPQGTVVPTLPPMLWSAAVQPGDVAALEGSHPLRRLLEEPGQLFSVGVNHLAVWELLPNVSQ